VVLSDGPAPATRLVSDGASFHDMWVTAESPARISRVESEPIQADESLAPPDAGTRVRVVDMPPGALSPMHRTESVDYGVVLAGTLTLILDGGATVDVHPGDLVVQRGTDHAWENRTATTTRVLFVLVAGRFDDGVRAAASGPPP
jgi:quercetin dioxygenase-like cupin family protein